MTSEGDTLEQLKQAIEHHRQALQALEEALLAELDSHRQEEENGNHHPQGALLSIKEVCEELGMGKSWVYQRLRRAEIPSIKLGGAVKVKRTDLNEFIENQPYRSFEKEEEKE
jgi:excisionase family DNA binding protein